MAGIESHRTKVKVLSYIDIFAGGAYFILTLIGGMTVLLLRPALPPPGPVDVVFGFLFGALLVLTAVVLLEGGEGKTYSRLGWADGILGTLFALDGLLVLTLSDITVTAWMIWTSAILSLLGSALLAYSGYKMRKILE